MKPMHFDFAAKPLYPKIWLAFALSLACIFALFGWQMHQLSQQSRSLAEQAKQLQAKRSQLGAISPPVIQPQYSPAFSKQASQAAQLLTIDLNKAFAALENLIIPGVRLQTLNINAAQNLIEVEFEFAQLSQASDISEALTAGYSKAPWQLVSTNAVSRGAPQAASAGPAFTGRWQAKLAQL